MLRAWKGTLRPNFSATFILMTSDTFFGVNTGRVWAFLPARICSAYTATNCPCSVGSASRVIRAPLSLNPECGTAGGFILGGKIKDIIQAKVQYGTLCSEQTIDLSGERIECFRNSIRTFDILLENIEPLISGEELQLFDLQHRPLVVRRKKDPHLLYRLDFPIGFDQGLDWRLAADAGNLPTRHNQILDDAERHGVVDVGEKHRDVARFLLRRQGGWRTVGDDKVGTDLTALRMLLIRTSWSGLGVT
jgi:hypothetical protein